MKYNLISTKEITDFEKETGYELIANERPKHMNLPLYYVCFECGEISEGCLLITKIGNGNTIDEALKDYCNQISGRRMVFNSRSEKRNEITLPKLIHTKLLNR